MAAKSGQAGSPEAAGGSGGSGSGEGSGDLAALIEATGVNLAEPGGPSGGGQADDLSQGGQTGGEAGEGQGQTGEGAGEGQLGEGAEGAGEGQGEGAGEGQSGEGTEGAGEGQGGEGEGLPHGVQKRIDKLTARAKAAEEERQALKARVAELEAAGQPKSDDQPKAPAAPARPPADLAESLPQVREIDQQILQVQGLIGAVRDLQGQLRRDQTEAVAAALKDAKIHLPNYDRESMEEYLQQTREAAADKLSERRAERAAQVASIRGQIEQRRQVATRQALELFPWMRDKTSPQFQEGVQLLRGMPWIMQYPDYLLQLGDLIEGRRARLARASQAGSPKAKPVRSPAGQGRAGAGTPANEKATRLAAKAKAVEERPSEETLKEFIAESLE